MALQESNSSKIFEFQSSSSAEHFGVVEVEVEAVAAGSAKVEAKVREKISKSFMVEELLAASELIFVDL